MHLHPAAGRSGSVQASFSAEKRGSEVDSRVMLWRYDVLVRTTLNLADDVYELARLLAQREGISLGAAISKLVRRGLNPVTTVEAKVGEFPVFHVPEGAETITLARTLQVEDEE